MEQITLAPAPPPSGLSFLSRRVASPSPAPTPAASTPTFRLGLGSAPLDEEEHARDASRRSVDTVDASIANDSGVASPPRSESALRGRRRSSGATSESASIRAGLDTAARGKEEERRLSISSTGSSRHSRLISFDAVNHRAADISVTSPERSRRTSLPAVRVQPASSSGSLHSTEGQGPDAQEDEADPAWPMTAASLQRWTHRAEKGGLARAVAIADNIAENENDLMFLIGDEIVLLKQLEDGLSYLGCCEGVFGRVMAAHIRLESAPASPARLPESESLASVSTAADFFVTAPSPPHSPTAKEATQATHDFEALGTGSGPSPKLEQGRDITSPTALRPAEDRLSSSSFAYRASNRASNPFELDLSSSDGDEGRRGSLSESEVPTPGRTPPPGEQLAVLPAAPTLQERRGLGELAIQSVVNSTNGAENTADSPLADDDATPDSTAPSRRKQLGRSRASNGAAWSGIGWMMSEDASLETPSSGDISPLSEAQAQAPLADAMSAKQKRANRRTGKLFGHDGSLSPVFSDDSQLSSPRMPSGGQQQVQSPINASDVLPSPSADLAEPRWSMVEPMRPEPSAGVKDDSPPASAVPSSVKMPFGKRDSSQVGTADGLEDSEEEWDIYGDYARDSMFFPPGMAPTAEQRASLRAAARASRIKSRRFSAPKGNPSSQKAVEGASKEVKDAQPPATLLVGNSQISDGPKLAQTKPDGDTSEAPAHSHVGVEIHVSKGPASVGPTTTIDSPERLSSGVSASSHMTTSTEPDALVQTPRPQSLEVHTPEIATTSPMLRSAESHSPPQMYGKGALLTPTMTTHSPALSSAGSQRSPTPTYSPHTTSMGATKLAVAQTGVSLHGELAANLTSARNPVPIQFLVGDANFIRARRTMTPPQQAGSADPSPSSSPGGSARVGLGLGPLPQAVAHGGTLWNHRRPTDPSPLVAKPVERPRSRSFSAMDRIEVPLPMHRSGSTNSLAEAYDDTGATSTSSMSNLIRKVSRKRSASVASRHESRPKTPTVPIPEMPSPAPQTSAGPASMPIMPSSATHANAAQSAAPRQPLQHRQLQQEGSRAQPPPGARQPAGSRPSGAASTPRGKPIDAAPTAIAARRTASPASPATLGDRPPVHLHPPRIDTALAHTHTSGSASPSERSLTPRTPITSSPISSKDFHRTMNMDGADFAMARADGSGGNYLDNFDRTGEPDEWGFVGISPVPPIYSMSVKEKKALPKLEQTMLSLIGKPRTPANQKKLAKLVIDATIPPSLRTKAWAWLLEDPAKPNPRIAFHDVAARTATGEARFDGREATRFFSNHHVFARGGRQMVTDLLNVYAIRHAKRTLDIDTTWIATILLTKSFHAEEAYWLYDGMVNQLRPVLAAHNLRNEAAVITELLTGLRGDLANKLKQAGVHALSFVSEWYTTLFAHGLPYPTVLRLFDLVLADGPLWLMRFALAVLTVSAERLVKMADGQAMVRYLLQPPADELVGPDNLVRAAVKLGITDQMVGKTKAKIGNVR